MDGAMYVQKVKMRAAVDQSGLSWRWIPSGSWKRGRRPGIADRVGDRLELTVD